MSTNSTLIGSSVAYTCHHGYRVDDGNASIETEQVITCVKVDGDGEWDRRPYNCSGGLLQAYAHAHAPCRLAGSTLGMSFVSTLGSSWKS